MQPRAHLTSCEFNICFSPSLGPRVILPIKLRTAHPITKSKIVTVFDAHSALFWCVDHEQPAQAPERLTAQKMLGLLIDDDYLFAPVPQFCCGCQTGQAATDDNCICTVIAHQMSFQRLRNQARNGIATAYIVIP